MCQVGVKTAFANIITSAVLTAILLWGTVFLTYLPVSALGAIATVICAALCDIPEMIRAFRVAKLDFIVLFFTFLVSVSQLLYVAV